MAKVEKAPRYVQFGNILTTMLLRAGFKYNGMGLKQHPIFLLEKK